MLALRVKGSKARTASTKRVRLIFFCIEFFLTNNPARSYIIEDETLNKIGFVIETSVGIPICRSCKHAVPPDEVYGHWENHPTAGNIKCSEVDVDAALERQIQDGKLVRSGDLQLPADGSPPVELLELLEVRECPVEQCGHIAGDSMMRKHFSRMRKNGRDDPHHDYVPSKAPKIYAQRIYFRTEHRSYFRVTVPPPSPRPTAPLNNLIQDLLDIDGELKRIPEVSDSRDLTAFLAKTGWVSIVKNCEIDPLRALINPPDAKDPLLPIVNAAKTYCSGVNKVIASRKFSSGFLCTIRQEYMCVSCFLRFRCFL